MNMIETKLFYERNDLVLNSEINCTYEELVAMTPDEFREWVIQMRKVVKESWDTYGCPPRTGKTEESIIDQWNKIAEYPIHEFTHNDELSDVDDDVIINKSRIGGEADQWFSNMMKVRINYTAKDNGYSIYDLFADDKHIDKMVKGGLRHFRKDSMYEHAKSAFTNSKKYAIINTTDANHWIETFFTAKHIFKGYDFILEEVKKREGLNSGYFQVEQDEILNLTKDEVQMYIDKGWLQYRHYSTFDVENMSDEKRYNIRVYKKGRKMFPKAFAAYRIGFIQPAVNFPPMTAKYLYERFTEDIKDQEVINIYDPSSGWGGRILGAMGCRDDRRIHYVGTDPNPDNFIDGTDYNKYASIADFYNTKTYRGNPFFSDTNTYEIFQEGSEEIGRHPDFQKYRGKLDLIFTSPPYFNREAYSEDANQSYKKYGSSYDSWVEGFLRPTLETCVDFLRDGRYLLWNIADLLVSGKYLTLEEDSRKILEECGMKYQYTLKMALEGMPGQNRMGEDGKPTCKNYCQVNGKYLKYEPVFVFKKEEK
tara:strand:+ start:486 stop:2093 length:1608 start_codon:yes stop_codon:yes gene_type:complete